MHYIYILYESFSNGFRHFFLDFCFLVSIFCGIFVIISKNPIISVLFLIGLFLSISGYLMLLGMNFIGLSYLLVYVGAVSILFLFILMLINVRISELLSDTSNSIPLAILVGIFFNYTLYSALPYSISNTKSINENVDFNLLEVISNNGLFTFFKKDIDNIDAIYVTSALWDGNLSESSHITSIGNIMYTSYSIWLIITSIILLLAMVGAIVITIKERS